MKNNFTQEYVRINGISQYFLHYPSPHKEVAVVLHGGPGQSEAHFAYCLRPYWDFCNVVYFDQRGTGKTQLRSKSKPIDVTMENLIQDLKLTISYVKEKYQTDRIILMGHSWGSILGTQYILKYPNDVLCYIGYGQDIDALCGEKIGYDRLRDSIVNKGVKSDIRKLNALGDFPNVLTSENYTKTITAFRKLQEKYGYSPNTAEILKIIIKSPVFSVKDIFPFINSSKTNKHLLDFSSRHNISETIEYKLPVFYLLGRNDWLTPSVLAAEYYEKINAPQKRLYWIENAGHLPDLENPVDFCEAIKEIISYLY